MLMRENERILNKIERRKKEMKEKEIEKEKESERKQNEIEKEKECEKEKQIEKESENVKQTSDNEFSKIKEIMVKERESLKMSLKKKRMKKMQVRKKRRGVFLLTNMQIVLVLFLLFRFLKIHLTSFNFIIFLKRGGSSCSAKIRS